MKIREERILNNNLIIQYITEHNISYAYCVECGQLINDSGCFYITLNGELREHLNRATFLKTRDYNGTEYRICRCKDCVAKKFPEVLKSKRMYSMKYAKYSKYAFGVSDEDFDEFSKERQRLTKEKMVKRWGEELGTQKWNDYCNKQAVSNSFEYKHEKYGMTRGEFDEYNRSRAVTLKNLINKHGEEEGTRIYNDYVERQRYTTSREYFIEEYGPEEGARKYDEFDKLRSENGAFGRNYSLISEELFKELVKDKLFEDHNIFYSDEEYVVHVPNHNYHLDFYDDDLNLVIEFQGTFFHKGKEEADIERMKLIQETLGNCAIFVNEMSYRSDRKKVINMILEYVKRLPEMSVEEKKQIYII